MWKGAPRALGAKPLWPYLVGAKADTIRLTASTQLLAIGAQRRGSGRSGWASCCSARPRRGRRRSVAGEPAGADVPRRRDLPELPGPGWPSRRPGWGPARSGNRLARGAL